MITGTAIGAFSLRCRVTSAALNNLKISVCNDRGNIVHYYGYVIMTLRHKIGSIKLARLPTCKPSDHLTSCLMING